MPLHERRSPHVAGSVDAIAGGVLHGHHNPDNLVSGNSSGPQASGAVTARADAGIASSKAHADDAAPGWTARAYAFLHRYSEQQTRPFTIEQFRTWAQTNGLDRPAEGRAYGSVTRTALRAGLIERVGYAPTASSNGGVKAAYARVDVPLRTTP